MEPLVSQKILFLLISMILWSSSPSALLPPVKHTVVIKSMKFTPSELKVNKGDSVIFINQDLVIHNVTEQNELWSSPNLPPKASWTYVVDKDVNYYCSLHPTMKGQLRVEEQEPGPRQ